MQDADAYRSIIGHDESLMWFQRFIRVCQSATIYWYAAGEGSTFDKFINALGKLGFIQQFSYFPVQYMDPGGQLAVFSFPPLKSNITIMRVK